MTEAIRDFEKSYLSTNDLSTTGQYLIAAIDTAADQSVILAAAATDPIVGVIQNKPKAGEAALVRHGGTSKVKAGGTITRGDMVTSDSAGKAVTTTTSSNATLGRALSSAVSGDLVEVLLVPSLY